MAFLSQQTRDDYERRIARRAPPSAGWPVLDPGADGLGLERQRFTPGRRRFVSIGTLEARKNTAALLDAFSLLWARGVDAELTIAGRVGPDAAGVRDFAAQQGQRVTLLEQATDEDLRRVLRQARAVIMPSEAEGFGLPPYEALHAGIAAVASMRLPSTAAMVSGAMLLERMDATSMADAIERMLIDDVATHYWEGAAALDLPTWGDFGRELTAWARSA